MMAVLRLSRLEAVLICFQATGRHDVETFVADWLSAHAHTKVYMTLRI